jgi:DNA-binding PadR family transcriptional regulator
MPRTPEDLLPLSAVAFEVLITLTEGAAHGYQIMQAVDARSGGDMTLHPGTLYRTLARLLEQDVIEEIAPRQAGAHERKTAFRLTRFGQAVAEAEAGRLARQVRRARDRRLLRGRS